MNDNTYLKIWNELVKTNYQIEIIKFLISVNMNYINNNSLTLEIKFKSISDLIKNFDYKMKLYY